MKKIKTIAVALLLSLGICATPALALTAADEDIITKAVETSIRSVLQIMKDSEANQASRDESPIDPEVLKYLNPREQVTVEGIARIEKMLNNQKSSASSLQASILGADDIKTTAEMRDSIEETIRSLNEKNLAATKDDTEEEIEITPISPLLLRSSSEPLMQFARGLTREAIPAEATKATLPVLEKEEVAATAEATRVPAERYHRSADETTSQVFSTRNLTILGISLTFVVIAIVLFFVNFERKLLATNGKFKHLSSFQEEKDTNKQDS